MYVTETIRLLLSLILFCVDIQVHNVVVNHNQNIFHFLFFIFYFFNSFNAIFLITNQDD